MAQPRADVRGDARGVRGGGSRAVTPRRTQIVAALDDIADDDLIERQDMVVTVTMGGYIKRTPLDTFRAQKRGGQGRSGRATTEERAIRELFVTSTPTPRLFFSTPGNVQRMTRGQIGRDGCREKGR